MTRLILARHGNTFGPQDKPVWVGARSDLPLVETGIAQARILGKALKEASFAPHAILCGPLQRTRKTATIVAEILNKNPATIQIDARLTEIDYGAWEGLSTAEIEDAGGGAELAAWDKRSIFPTTPGWKPSEAQIMVNVAALLVEMQNSNNLIITSNGILRFFARTAVNAGTFPDRKVATGNICVMQRAKDGWHILHWNAAPAANILA